MNIILQFATEPVPTDWAARSIEERLTYWKKPTVHSVETRRTVCAVEIWCELFGRNRAELTQAEARKINRVLAQLNDYTYSCSVDCGPYGRQRAFVRRALPKHWTRIARLCK